MTQPTPAELLALDEEVRKSLAEAIDTFKGTPRLEKFLMIERYINALTTLSAREDGWQLVPVEPTPEQVASGVRNAAWMGNPVEASERECRRIYAAMLAAAPKAPTAGEGT